MTTVIAPLRELRSITPPGSCRSATDCRSCAASSLPEAPADAVWGAHTPDGRVGEEPNVLAVLTVTQERSVRAPVSIARGRFRRVLTALRLFERGGYALGPVAWTRTDTGAWRPVAFGSSGRPRFMTLIPAAQEDGLRAFCNLITRRAPTVASWRGRWRASRWAASAWRRSRR